ncbi:uncharacterized protein PAC_08457 [Phialocephala subalpina]|uniref:Uncharacterized protein n=1 Tax=Phialocephala subalpina TaxID=576137 RepID=A0A1L7X0L8_9HELO|nr:uncharacterized protein PAC_08457 [Phialocephala subalpina]
MEEGHAHEPNVGEFEAEIEADETARRFDTNGSRCRAKGSFSEWDWTCHIPISEDIEEAVGLSTPPKDDIPSHLRCNELRNRDDTVPSDPRDPIRKRDAPAN